MIFQKLNSRHSSSFYLLSFLYSKAALKHTSQSSCDTGQNVAVLKLTTINVPSYRAKDMECLTFLLKFFQLTEGLHQGTATDMDCIWISGKNMSVYYRS